MTVFVLDMVCNGVIYDEDRSNLEEEIRRLRSIRKQLTHRCRILRKEHENDVSQYRTLLRQPRSQLTGQEQQIVIHSRETEKIISSESEIRANLFREMIDLAKPHTIPRYSKNLYYAAIVILFPSRSIYEFLCTFLPLPSPRAVYSHFGPALSASRGRLQSLDVMIAYLWVQIALSPELTAGCVFAIDVISCSNTLIGMRRIDMSDIAYLFVIYLQPIKANIKCCPLFVIESPSGIGNERIQAHIDEILALIQSLIPRHSLPQTATRHITSVTKHSWTFGSPFIKDSAWTAHWQN
jgi:hypothetical protein